MADDQVVSYNCCKNKSLKTVVCIVCGEAFHAGCKERNWADADIIGSILINCCRNSKSAKQLHKSDSTNLEILYERLLEAKESELQAKDELLSVKDQLIKELYNRIDILNGKINNKNQNQTDTITSVNDTSSSIKNQNRKNLTYADKTAGKAITPSNNSNSTPPTESNANTLPVVQTIAKEQVQMALEVYKTKQTAERIIGLEDDIRTTTINRQEMQKPRHHRLGTGQVTLKTFCGPEKRAWIYLYRVNTGATEQQVREHIIGHQGFDNHKVTVKELPGEPNQLKRFVITAPLSKKDELYDTAFWPKNVGIRRFDFKKHQGFLKLHSADFS